MPDRNDTALAIAKRLRAVRATFNLDQKTFAERADILPQTYGPFETAKRDLTLAAAKKLKQTYGLTLDYMFFGEMGGLPHRIAEALRSAD